MRKPSEAWAEGNETHSSEIACPTPPDRKRQAGVQLFDSQFAKCIVPKHAVKLQAINSIPNDLVLQIPQDLTPDSTKSQGLAPTSSVLQDVR